MDFFAQKGHSILSYDLPGHGDSPLETEDYCFSDLINLNARILNKFKIQSPILCGHSLGGMIHAGYAAKYLDSEASLVLCGSLDANPTHIGPRFLSDEHSKELSASLDAYMEDGFKLFKRQKKYDYFENNQIDDEIINIINRRYSNPVASKINLSTLGSFDVRSQLIELNLPVLTLHGENEQVIDKKLVEAMGKSYKNIRQRWYPNGGHLAFYQQTDLTTKYLAENYDFVVNGEPA